MVNVLDVRGGGAGVDVAFAVGWRPRATRARPPTAWSTPDWRLLEAAQEEIAEVTTDPHPQPV